MLQAITINLCSTIIINFGTFVISVGIQCRPQEACVIPKVPYVELGILIHRSVTHVQPLHIKHLLCDKSISRKEKRVGSKCSVNDVYCVTTAARLLPMSIHLGHARYMYRPHADQQACVITEVPCVIHSTCPVHLNSSLTCSHCISFVEQ